MVKNTTQNAMFIVSELFSGR